MLDRRHLRHCDWSLFAVTLILMGIGFFAIHSATHMQDGMVSGFTIRQIQAAMLGVGLLAGAFFFDYRWLVRFSPVLYVGGLFLLLFVIWKGVFVMGAQRWLQIGPLRVQPSEFMKLIVPLTVIAYVSRLKLRQLTTRHLLIPGMILGVPLLLIKEQPDLGTALSLIPPIAAVVFVAGLRTRTIVAWCLLGILCIPLVTKFVLKPYQLKRITTLWNAEEQMREAGWQVIQSKIAIGAGGRWGRGYLEGKQSQLGFIPEHHTDFVFSVLAEEFGFFKGSLPLLFLYGFLFFRGYRIARQSKDREGAYLAVALVVGLAFQTLYNIAMVSGLAPITGIPLPLVSYGRSSLLASTMVISLLLNISMRRET